MMGHRATGAWSQPDLARVRVMISSSFRLLFLSLLPFVFIHFELPSTTIWAWCSGIGAATGVVYLVITLKMARSVAADITHKKAVQYFNIALGIVVLLIQFANATGIGFDQSFGPYLLALLLYFMIPCISFWRLLETAFETK